MTAEFKQDRKIILIKMADSPVYQVSGTFHMLSHFYSSSWSWWFSHYLAHTAQRQKGNPHVRESMTGSGDKQREWGVWRPRHDGQDQETNDSHPSHPLDLWISRAVEEVLCPQRRPVCMWWERVELCCIELIIKMLFSNTASHIRGVLFQNPPDIPKSKDAQILYIKWHSISL